VPGESTRLALFATLIAGCQFNIGGLMIGGGGTDGGSGPQDLAVPSGSDLAQSPSPDLAQGPRFSRVDLWAGSSYGFTNGLGAAAQLANPNGLAADGSGNLYVADVNNALIRMIDSNANVTTLAGQLNMQVENDGGPGQASFDHPVAISWDGITSLWVCDYNASTIRQIVVPGAAVSTLIAPGTLNQPKGIVADGAGNLYVSDSSNSVIRQITIKNSKVTTLAGTIGQPGFMDGTGAAARFNEPRGLALDGAGTLYVADGVNNAIRAIVIATGQVTTVVPAGLRYPRGLVFDSGTLFIADTENNCVQAFDVAAGALSVLAGVPGTAAQQLGPLPAEVFAPWGLAKLPSGALVFTDSSTNEALIIH
jgi:YVTN family beta-propeller protein